MTRRYYLIRIETEIEKTRIPYKKKGAICIEDGIITGFLKAISEPIRGNYENNILNLWFPLLDSTSKIVELPFCAVVKKESLKDSKEYCCKTLWNNTEKTDISLTIVREITDSYYQKVKVGKVLW